MLPRRTFFILTICVLLAGATFGARAGAQEPPAQTTLQINQIDSAGYPQIRAVVSATGADDLPVAGLTQTSFTAFEGGEQITLASVTPASDPDMRLGVVVAIDVSAEMAGAPLDAAKAAAIAFVQGLGPADEAALIAFNNDVTGVTGFTIDKNAVIAGIAGLEASGPSALYEAAQVSSYAASASSAPRKAVVLLSAGPNSRTSGVSESSALEVATTVGAPVFTVAMGANADESFLQSLAATTMGQHRGTTPDGVPLTFAAIATVLRGQYVLALTADGAADSQMSELRIIAEVAGAPAGAVAPFRRGAASAVPLVESEGGSDLARFFLIALLVIVALAAIAGVAYGALLFLRRLRLERKQRAVTAPNIQRATAQGLPRREGEYRTAAASATAPLEAPSITGPVSTNGDAHHEDEAPAPDPTPEPAPRPAAAPSSVLVASEGSAPALTGVGVGRFIEKTATGRGATYELGPGPIVIGSSSRESTIVLPASVDVAPAHVRIWLRDGKYTMHHAGGFRRRTLVGGQPTEWCVLEHGDEVQIGPHRLVYEEFGHERALRF